MTRNTYDGSIDWDRYWTESNDKTGDSANPSALHATDSLAEFIAETGTPATVADVGCGAGAATFGIAERYPETAVVGYDAAEPVLAENRQRARDDGIENARFQQAILPAFDPDRSFGVVFCYFTLCYVRDVERALWNLYDAVEPGGVLVFNYLNEGAQSYCLEAAEAPEKNENHAFVFDPEKYTKRFGAVLDGDSVLTTERIHDALGVQPQSVWSVVDKPDKRWAWHHVPLVYVPK